MLTERRAADRAKMADVIEKLATEFGATCTRRNGGVLNPERSRAIRLEIAAARGLCVAVTFDGDHARPNVYVLSWHMQLDATAKLNDDTFGGNVNPHHRQKATYVAYGFDDLCEQLGRGLRMAADGSAFLPEKENQPVTLSS